jgi:hypothetical protein
MEVNMPMLFWLPMIILGGMWSMALEAASPARKQAAVPVVKPPRRSD